MNETVYHEYVINKSWLHGVFHVYAPQTFDGRGWRVVYTQNTPSNLVQPAVTLLLIVPPGLEGA